MTQGEAYLAISKATEGHDPVVAVKLHVSTWATLLDGCHHLNPAAKAAILAGVLHELKEGGTS